MVTVDGLNFTISLGLISIAMHMANEGIRHSRDVRTSQANIRNFLDDGELMPTKRKSSYEVNSLAYPWNSVAVAFYTLFTLEGRHLEVEGFHFVLMTHFRGKLQVNLPYFMYHSLD